MKAIKKAALAATLLASLGFATSGHAGVVDLFDDPSFGSQDKVLDPTVGAGISNIGGTNGSGTQVGGGWYKKYGDGTSTSILGGYRDLYVEMVGNTNADPSESQSVLTAGGGALTFSNTSGAIGYGKIQWDGSDIDADLDIDGLGGQDVTAGCGGPSSCTTFIASVLEADQGFEYKITVYDMAGHGAILTANTLFPIGSAYDSTYQFSWFNLPQGAYVLDMLPLTITRVGLVGDIDFKDLGALQLELNTNSASPSAVSVDLRLSSVTTVPEPGSLALVGLALAGVGLASKRRKTVA